MKKQIGIWLDFKEALLVEQIEGEAHLRRISSDVERNNPVGGSRSKAPYGPMVNVSESKMLERRKHQEKDYFKAIYQSIAESEAVYVFGPAEAKDGFVKFLEGQHRKPTLVGVEKADSLTDNQVKAKVRDFFGW